MMRWLSRIFRRQHGMPSLADLPMQSRLTAVWCDQARVRSAMR